MFSSTDQGLNLPSSVLGNNTALSIELWLTTTTGSRNSRVFEFGPVAGSDTNSVLVYKERNSGNIYMCAGQPQCYSSAIGFDSQNLHLVMTLSVEGYARLYINGTLAIIASYALPAIPTPTFFSVGRWSTTDQYMIGSVHEFRIWKGVLSPAEVLSNFFSGTGLNECSDLHDVCSIAFSHEFSDPSNNYAQVTSALWAIHKDLGVAHCPQVRAFGCFLFG